MHPGDIGGNEHLHIFFGNTGTNANSTYESLRQSGDSTCRNMLNRSAYWQPAMIGTLTDGSEAVVVEEFTNFYYKRRPASDPEIEGIPVAIPRGLKFVFGGPSHPAQFKCIDETGNKNVTQWVPTLQKALSLCAAGQHIDMQQSTPNCWDGRNLDSPDHNSHLSYTIRDSSTGWKQRCPATHPYVIPKLNFQRIFKIRADDVTSTWRLSSDMSGYPAGTMAHADYMMAWNDEIMGRIMAACIDQLLSCSAGDLGDGFKMVENPIYKSGIAASARRVPLPRRGEVISLVNQGP
ncbi:DUF1996 domain-containing protein [Croceibacterium salegens]|uniref:DUF1996 domain-containing protein n=1 Tax=Croceibacterium salegens TaxID=1737568 RepID=UPI002E26041D